MHRIPQYLRGQLEGAHQMPDDFFVRILNVPERGSWAPKRVIRAHRVDSDDAGIFDLCCHSTATASLSRPPPLPAKLAFRPCSRLWNVWKHL